MLGGGEWPHGIWACDWRSRIWRFLMRPWSKIGFGSAWGQSRCCSLVRIDMDLRWRPFALTIGDLCMLIFMMERIVKRIGRWSFQDFEFSFSLPIPTWIESGVFLVSFGSFLGAYVVGPFHETWLYGGVFSGKWARSLGTLLEIEYGWREAVGNSFKISFCLRLSSCSMVESSRDLGLWRLGEGGEGVVERWWNAKT